MLGLAIVIVIAVFNAGSVFGLATGGDPGGRILGELKPAALAVPDDAKIRYRHDVEPKWDSCDGRQGTFGWDDVVLQHLSESAKLVDRVTFVQKVGVPDLQIARVPTRVFADARVERVEPAAQGHA